MKNPARHVGTCRIVCRLPSSTNGNPRWLLTIAGKTCRTSVDSSLGYAIQNYDGLPVNAIIGTHYGLSTLDTIALA